MNWKLPIFLIIPCWTTLSQAQTIEIDGRPIRLQEKPDQPYRHEPRDALRLIEEIGLPKEIDLTATQTPVKDQGNRGSCAYFTTIALFEHALKLNAAGQQDLNISEEYLIYANKALDQINVAADGSYLANNIRTFQTRGMLLEESMSYTHSWFDKGMPCESYTDDASAPTFCRSHYPPQATDLEKLIVPQSYEFQVDRLTSMREVTERLAQGHAVTISIPVNQSGWRGEKGLVQHNEELEAACKETPKICGGHTILLTGYNLEEKVYYFKNSWGKVWGANGYGRIPFEYVQKWSYGDFFAASVKRLDRELQNQSVEPALTPVQVEVKRGVNAVGQDGIFVSMQFEYQAPVGSYFYVSLFPQLKEVKVDVPEPVYLPVYVTQEDGAKKVLTDRRFVHIKSPSDLVYGADKALELFISQADIEKAGVWGVPELYLRPTIYKMSDYESYGVLYRDYLSLPIF